MDIVEDMRGFEIDHDPDGWPAVRMREISALCDEVERLRECLRWLQQRHHGGLMRAKIDAALAPPDE